MALRRIWVLAALGAMLLTASAPAAEVAQGGELEYPHAGIALRLPEGFRLRVLREPFDAMRAVRSEGETNVQGVTLSAYWVAKGTSVEAYADQLTDELEQNLAVRHLKVLKKVPDFAVAGTTGAACVLKYTFRGDRTAAARVCFLRELPDAKQDLCYALLVEAPEARQAQVLPVLGEVLKTLRLLRVRRPWEVPVGRLGDPYRAAKGTFTVRPPEGWFVEDAAGGVAFGQMDYLRGGTQWVQITAHRLNGSRTSPEQAKECIRLGRSRFPAAEILEEGPVTVAGIAGYQFVLRHSHASQTASQSTTQEVEPPLMVVQNVLCVPGTGEEPGTHYSMVLTSSGGDLENLRGILSRIAEGLEIPGVTNSPASAPTTKPAAEPMTAPASPEPGDP